MANCHPSLGSASGNVCNELPGTMLCPSKPAGFFGCRCSLRSCERCDCPVKDHILRPVFDSNTQQALLTSSMGVCHVDDCWSHRRKLSPGQFRPQQLFDETWTHFGCQCRIWRGSDWFLCFNSARKAPHEERLITLAKKLLPRVVHSSVASFRCFSIRPRRACCAGHIPWFSSRHCRSHFGQFCR